jgi:hypothetical protein
MNPFMIYVYDGYDYNKQAYYRTLRKVTIFPIIPSFSYGIRF